MDTQESSVADNVVTGWDIKNNAFYCLLKACTGCLFYAESDRMIFGGL